MVSKFEGSFTGGQTEEVRDALIEKFEKERIVAGDEFSGIYSEYAHDIARTEQLKAIYDNNNSPEESLGKKGEALIFSLLTEGTLNKHLQFRASHPYDDFFHGVDMLVEAKNQKNPAVATIDVTINQKDIKGISRQGSEMAETRPVGLDEKLARIRKHIDYLSNFDPGHARTLSVWLNSGGLHQLRTEGNKRSFADAEKVFVVKYYKTPEDSDEPLKPTYVIGGPQAVISMDNIFINRALQGNEEAKEMVRALSLLEFAYGIHTIQKYLNEQAQSKPSRNLFFDTYYIETNAWSEILSQPALEEFIGDLGQKYQHNSEFRKQLSYYIETLSAAFKK